MTDAVETNCPAKDCATQGHKEAACGGLAVGELSDTGPDPEVLTRGPFRGFAAGAVSGLRRGGRAIAEFLLPPVCLICNDALAGHDSLCGPCWRRVNFIHAPLCDRTGLPLPYDTGGTMLSAAALAHPPVYDRARAVAHFDQVMRDLVHSFKYYDRQDLRHLLGRWLLGAAAPLLPGTQLVIPVPLNRLKLLQRRFNQSAILAQDLARAANLRFEPLALSRPRRTESQVGKTAEQRRRNVAGAFATGMGWKSGLKGKNILLVDDVITTGATVDACARVLKQAGARRIDVVALAKRTGALSPP